MVPLAGHGFATNDDGGIGRRAVLHLNGSAVNVVGGETLAWGWWSLKAHRRQRWTGVQGCRQGECGAHLLPGHHLGIADRRAANGQRCARQRERQAARGDGEQPLVRQGDGALRGAAATQFRRAGHSYRDVWGCVEEPDDT